MLTDVIKEPGPGQPYLSYDRDSMIPIRGTELKIRRRVTVTVVRVSDSDLREVTASR
jgi:hypothetical protein